MKVSFVMHLEIDGEVNPKALQKILLQRLVSKEDRIKVLSSSILPEHLPTKEEKIIKFQYPRARFISGAWVRLVYEDGSGKQRRTQGIILNLPVLMLHHRKSNIIREIPIANITSVESYAPPKIVAQWEIEDQARRLVELIREKENRLRKVVRYQNFLLERQRQTRLEKIKRGKA